MKLNEAVSKRIFELCRERNMTQYQLHIKSGVSQSTLSTIANCTYPSMKLRIIYEICEGFEISLNEFFLPPFSIAKILMTEIPPADGIFYFYGYYPIPQKFYKIFSGASVFLPPKNFSPC